jgi:hypothetical protein
MEMVTNDGPSFLSTLKTWASSLLSPPTQGFGAGVPEPTLGEKLWDATFGPSPVELMRQTRQVITATQRQLDQEWEVLRFDEEQAVKKITRAAQKPQPSEQEIRRLAKDCVKARVAMRRIEPNKQIIDSFVSELRDWETLNAINEANALLTRYIARTPMLRDIKQAQVNLSQLSAQKTQLNMVKDVMRDEMEMNDDVQEEENAEVEAIVREAMDASRLQMHEALSMQQQAPLKLPNLSEAEANARADALIEELMKEGGPGGNKKNKL